MTFEQLQAEVGEWSRRNFPNNKPYFPLLGAVEKIGELAHAHLKLEQGIRGTEQEHRLAKIDAVADAVIYLADYCERSGINFATAVEETWSTVKQRDWQKNRENGQTHKNKMKANKIPLLVTTAHRGVFYGYSQPTENKTIRLENARMCVYWSAELKGVLGLATMGPTRNCKIGPAVPALTLQDVTSVTEVSKEAAEQWEKGHWNG